MPLAVEAYSWPNFCIAENFLDSPMTNHANLDALVQMVESPGESV